MQEDAYCPPESPTGNLKSLRRPATKRFHGYTGNSGTHFGTLGGVGSTVYSLLLAAVNNLQAVDSSILDRADLAAENHNGVRQGSGVRQTVVYRQQCPMMQIDLSAKAARNLSVLKKIDSNVSEIISEASDTAIYKFDAAQKKWDRHGVQGAVFITQNIQAPFHSLIVLNKLGKFNAFNVKAHSNLKMFS